MAIITGMDKLGAWRQRLAKFGASGLSVSAFCRRENIAPARFYYWSRRVRDAGNTGGQDRSVTILGERPSATTESSVEIFIGANVKVRLPGTDHELIKFVLSSLQPDTATNSQPSAFARIDFNDTWRPGHDA